MHFRASHWHFDAEKLAPLSSQWYIVPSIKKDLGFHRTVVSVGTRSWMP
jgi:hypothetical protein